MVITAWVANTFTPTLHLSEFKQKIDLPNQIPKSFGEWQEDSTLVPILPNPQVQAKLDALYSSTLARTYRNTTGQRVMLSIAYGSDQSSEATAVHRPEFCYSAQGFKVSDLGQATLSIGRHQINVQRLLGMMGQRREIITYWITIDEAAMLPGLSRKMAQLRYGLRGEIPDGLLFRVSSLSINDQQSYDLQNQFLNDLSKHISSTLAPRYFGKSIQPIFDSSTGINLNK
jgi:EpsI family protein